MEEEEKTRPCPTCQGSGVVSVVVAVSKTATARPLAIKLRNDGYSIREIAAMLGYTHPGSISNLLRENGKKKKKKK